MLNSMCSYCFNSIEKNNLWAITYIGQPTICWTLCSNCFIRGKKRNLWDFYCWNRWRFITDFYFWNQWRFCTAFCYRLLVEFSHWLSTSITNDNENLIFLPCLSHWRLLSFPWTYFKLWNKIGNKGLNLIFCHDLMIVLRNTVLVLISIHW